MNVESISVALSGPPPVVIQISANCWDVQMRSSSAMETMIGLSWGMVIDQNLLTGPAPSTSAAS